MIDLRAELGATSEATGGDVLFVISGLIASNVSAVVCRRGIRITRGSPRGNVDTAKNVVKFTGGFGSAVTSTNTC